MSLINALVGAQQARGLVARLARSMPHIAGLLICCAVALNAHAQTADNTFDQTIDDDLQAQAQAEMETGHGKQALELLNELVQRDPRQAGALLDVAVLYCRLGERDLSLQALARIEKQYAVPPNIEKLISIYRANTCTPDGSRPRLAASIGTGVTSNANFGPSNPFVTFIPSAPFQSYALTPESLAHSDQYVESALQGELPIRALPGITLLGALSDRQYRDQHGYDQRTATLGIAHQKIFDHGEVDNQFTADMLWLGTSVYQHDLAWHSAYWSPATTLRTMLARAGFDFTLTDSSYPGNSLYNSLHAELRAAFQAHIGQRTTVLLFAGPAWDRPQGDRPGGTRHGYSGWFSVDYDLGRHGQFEAVLQQNTANDAAPYSPAFFGDVAQHQTLRSVSLRYSYPLQRGWSVYAQASAQRVSDTISLFAYTVRDGSVGLAWKY
jgi:tetratricopeptide (TPR) repeat protein